MRRRSEAEGGWGGTEEGLIPGAAMEPSFLRVEVEESGPVAPRPLLTSAEVDWMATVRGEYVR